MHVWLDLGGVVIGTPGARGPLGEDKLRFMPGAREYLQRLIACGYSIGVITNIPESFGQPGNYLSKRRALEALVERKWDDPEHPFDWSIFDHVLLPLWDRERKPAPKLFLDARRLSAAQGKVGFYQGETAAEIEASRKLGVPAFQVRYDHQNRPIFLPPEKILDFVEPQR